ncbi:hypothetical protein ACGF7W_35115 [Streptomyces sp. NPDC048219]|uniref:hypothetical protein n=1 Tax=Streptomyces sp. NPDC048219 TaxID=3365517 RepID=UPI00371A9FE7
MTALRARRTGGPAPTLTEDNPMTEPEKTYEISWEDGNQDIAESVMWAAEAGAHLVVTVADGRTVRLVPDPGPQEPPSPLDGITVQEVSRSTRPLRTMTEQTQVLYIDGAPKLPAGDGHPALSPGIVWIEYVQEPGQPVRFRAAHVSGYRVEHTGSPADRVVSASFFRTTPTPSWLAELITRYQWA